MTLRLNVVGLLVFLNENRSFNQVLCLSSTHICIFIYLFMYLQRLGIFDILFGGARRRNPRHGHDNDDDDDEDDDDDDDDDYDNDDANSNIADDDENVRFTKLSIFIIH